MTTPKKKLTFAGLVDSIKDVDLQLTRQAGKAINISLTLRNWLIGFHIAEFELQGVDRAQYGEKLLARLSARLTELNISNCNKRQLYRYVRFYKAYPGIVGTLSPQLKQLLPPSRKVPAKVGAASPQFVVAPEMIITHLSYSMIELITDLDDLSFPEIISSVLTSFIFCTVFIQIHQPNALIAKPSQTSRCIFRRNA